MYHLSADIQAGPKQPAEPLSQRLEPVPSTTSASAPVTVDDSPVSSEQVCILRVVIL